MNIKDKLNIFLEYFVFVGKLLVFIFFLEMRYFKLREKIVKEG